MHEFILVNNTNSHIMIGNISKSCGCTNASVQQNLIESGKSTICKVVVELSGIIGKRSVSCDIIKDDGVAAWRCTLDLDVRRKIVFTPNVVHFGVVRLGQSAEQQLVIDLTAGQDDQLPKIKSIKAGSESIKVDTGGVLEARPDAPKKRTDEVRVNVVLLPQETGGQGQSEVIVQYADGEHGDQEARVPIDWNVKGLYSVSPERVFLGIIHPDTLPPAKEVLIQREDGQPFDISRAETTDKAVTCELLGTSMIDGKHTQKLRITIKTNFHTSINGSIAIKLNDLNKTNLRFPYNSVFIPK
jgi:hypothetical protein